MHIAARQADTIVDVKACIKTHTIQKKEVLVLMKEILNVSNLSKSYGSVLALNHVSFVIKQNEVVGLIGNNGAGKSTLIKILVRLLQQDEGNIQYQIEDFQPKQDIGVMCQEVSMPEKLRVAEWITMVQRFCKDSYALDYVLKIAGIEDLADKYATNLSGGQKRRVQFALAIIGKPKILFLDEPTVGMDFGSRVDFWNQIYKMLREGVTVLLASHDLGEVESVVDRVLMIDHGTILLDKDVNVIRKDSSAKIYVMKNEIEPDSLSKLIAFASKEKKFEEGRDYVGFTPVDIDQAVIKLQTAGISFANVSIEREGLVDLMKKHVQNKEG